VLFPLTPSLSLEERENRIQSFSQIRALDLRGGSPEFQPSAGCCSLSPRERVRVRGNDALAFLSEQISLKRRSAFANAVRE
jgi:hypothetical protein